MKIPRNKTLFFWTFLMLTVACSQTHSVPVEFSISQGVINKMDFSSVGIQPGQQLPDITFYTLDGEAFNLSKIKHIRPKLLITGSYTCDITREKLYTIDWFYEQYKEKADIYLINTLEAHPQSSPSPYSMSEVPWPAIDNIQAGITAEQPRTMDERIGLAEKWIKEEKIKTPVLLDGPKNEFWNLAGQAPNMAILISSSGGVVLKQSWFDEQEIKETMEIQLKNLNLPQNK
ncbi:hypothetical protein [Algoriphagus antarcticus]|uniref:Iodothyronine deiodinase n=1 Tax=Algoriphagus antarcticus TaxID=238540 RepID=A0A3E0E0W7_9BACT|nr:hypothetical protein [Algoriphagus antarcticus]REG91937.1 hypothetical protein C8N25_10314 [Algoriphagus antarcticus]